MAERPHRRPASRSFHERRDDDAPVLLYGLHTVAAALGNPRRRPLRLLATRNALARLEERLPAGERTPEAEIVEPRALDRLLPADAVHQGVALYAEPLEPVALADLAGARLLVALDQVTDPHNVGAIMRSAVALGADGIVTTTRHAARESGVLAKAASGAADLLAHATVGSLAKALEELKGSGFTIVGLDSEGEADLEHVAVGGRAVLVLGSEGKGLRPGVRAAADAVARLEVPGPLASLNVSNAAAIALYVIGRRLAAA
jgi:23S rRNA (guanosine2251-2'-O)-methyltransferase